jgi:predicted site-specific integrase-resolvase
LIFKKIGWEIEGKRRRTNNMFSLFKRKSKHTTVLLPYNVIHVGLTNSMADVIIIIFFKKKKMYGRRLGEGQIVVLFLYEKVSMSFYIQLL